MKTNRWITGVAVAAALAASGLVGNAWAQPGKGADRDRGASAHNTARDRDQGRNPGRNFASNQDRNRSQSRVWNGRRTVTYRPTRVAVPKLSTGRIALRVGAGHFFYDQGRFYTQGTAGFAWVTAPVGAWIPRLPLGFTIVYSSGTPYYYYAGTYYVQAPTTNGYTVVTPPQAADNFDAIVMADGSSLTGHYLGGDYSTIHFQVGGTIYDVDRSDVVSLSLAQPNSTR